MAALSSPMHLFPTITPRRAPSPIMSPGGRRGRAYASSEESRLRDLSPDTTLRAFTQKPMPFDTTYDEYKIFSCIESLTAAERDLGARVAKAAQRLQSWCTEIEQWGWSGSFDQPSEEHKEKRRRSLELRIREHVGDADLTNSLPPLEYWGSLLSVEVQSHEARLDDIEGEMLQLDVEELKEHVLDMHPAGRSRPSSAGFEANRQHYKPMDDFSFLITQTLLSALPHHAQLKDRLSTWTARIATLRAVPRFLDHLSTAQKAMRLGWDAIDPPADTSDAAFTQWKEATDTISGVLGSKVSDLGKRLDRMLDTLEGRDDCIPDRWIDIFENIEQDYGRWSHESRRRAIDFDVRRRWEQKGTAVQPKDVTSRPETHPEQSKTAPPVIEQGDLEPATQPNSMPSPPSEIVEQILPRNDKIASSQPHALVTPIKAATPPVASVTSSNLLTSTISSSSTNNDTLLTSKLDEAAQDSRLRSEVEQLNRSHAKPQPLVIAPKAQIPSVLDYTIASPPSTSTPTKKPWFMVNSAPPTPKDGDTTEKEIEPLPAAGSATVTRLADSVLHDQNSEPLLIVTDPALHNQSSEDALLVDDEDSEFDEGDTVVHNELEDSPEITRAPQSLPEIVKSMETGEDAQENEVVRFRRRPAKLSNAPIIITNDGQDGTFLDPPQTPRSRRGSNSSISSDLSFDSSPPGIMEDSPSVRNATNRSVRAPRPELNAAMAKRRAPKPTIENSINSAPWPPSQFSQKPLNSAEDLERKISDILTTIPAHIRLTSGPGADAPEVKPRRGVAPKGSKGFLRAARSVSGLKSPELTLSPAKNEFEGGISGRKSAAAARTDNDIKVYHLTQPGKEQPVKLFIRRVGENGERVMVRVGGGWADLGEYLRQYAEHHGRRTASEGKFEILGLEVKNSDTMSSPTRSESAMSKRERGFSSGHPTSPLGTPVKSTAAGTSNDDGVPPMPNFASTPGIAEETSVPSTNSSRRSWGGDEVGLSGPKAKKLDLSGDKLEWIEGMMKQARTVSGNVMAANHVPFQREERASSRSESRSDSRAGGKKPEFGDLGKVGGTKRIFFKGGKPVTGE
ncbi:hypothetical protein GQ44DRAFT_700275 [Phaeosphaeriaceae sp. PMI808]|nr:hypothetical protein GQ44DRAFT_700275 [Phaeosphaeriaceae sp. PMI808]